MIAAALKIAEEKLLPNEEEFLNSVIASFVTQMRGLWKPGGFERGGNTKTQGIVRGEFIVHDNLPPQFRYGIYAKPQTFRCWVRFSGPGPYITPDIVLDPEPVEPSGLPFEARRLPHHPARRTGRRDGACWGRGLGSSSCAEWLASRLAARCAGDKGVVADDMVVLACSFRGQCSAGAYGNLKLMNGSSR